MKEKKFVGFCEECDKPFCSDCNPCLMCYGSHKGTDWLYMCCSECSPGKIYFCETCNGCWCEKCRPSFVCFGSKEKKGCFKIRCLDCGRDDFDYCEMCNGWWCEKCSPSFCGDFNDHCEFCTRNVPAERV